MGKMNGPADLLPRSLTVDSERIWRYAELTHDANPIHLDPDFAARTPMGGIIAHGTMSLNLIWQSLTASLSPEAIQNLMLDVRFVRPVRIGDTVTAGGRRREDVPFCYDVWVRNNAGETVIEGSVMSSPADDRSARRRPAPGNQVG
jgi:acyl dehydratase